MEISPPRTEIKIPEVKDPKVSVGCSSTSDPTTEANFTSSVVVIPTASVGIPSPSASNQGNVVPSQGRASDLQHSKAEHSGCEPSYTTAKGDQTDINKVAQPRQAADVEKHTEAASKPSKEDTSYLRDMDERIKKLESRLGSYDTSVQKQSLGKQFDLIRSMESKTRKVFESDSSQSCLNPEIWKVFQTRMEQPEHGFYAIDVLIGEPKTRLSDWSSATTAGNSSNTPRRPAAIETEEGKGAAKLDDDAELMHKLRQLRGISVPERIRIHSAPLRWFLFYVLCPRKATVTFLDSPIILRPYKLLVQNQSKIVETLVSLRVAQLEISRISHDDIDPEIFTFCTHSKASHKGRTRPAFAQSNEEALMKFQATFGCFCIRCTGRGVDDLASLVEFLEQYINPITLPLRDRSASEVSFQSLWYVFQPGDIVTSKRMKRCEDGSKWYPQAFRVICTKGGRYHLFKDIPAPSSKKARPASTTRPVPIKGINPFVIDAYYLDFDGSKLCPVRMTFVIDPFPGKRQIKDLAVFPLEYNDSLEMKKPALLERGQSFVALCRANHNSIHHMQCRSSDLVTMEEVDGQVIVDTAEYYSIPETEAPSFSLPDGADVSETMDCSRGNACSLLEVFPRSCGHGDSMIYHDYMLDEEKLETFIPSPIYITADSAAAETSASLSSDDYVVCHYRVHVFLLGSKKWGTVPVQDLEQVQRVDNESGFDLLKLPKTYKSIIKSQVSEHFQKRQPGRSSKRGDVDIVRGKGRGLIILLHGAPGVGKTSTAECVADFAQRPLFPITCGDLGATAEVVEARLAEHFTMASKWGCVMLLDEADVFLAAREPADYQRNAIVSVFLRMMEYYTGILFLTTNRVGSFEEAFKSRIHISLFYPKFDRKTTLDVFNVFIVRAQKLIDRESRDDFKIDTKAILRFAKDHYDSNDDHARWNGRQIRNAFQTAMAMADYDYRHRNEDNAPPKSEKSTKHGVTLGRKQFKAIADTMADFDRYLFDTLGVTWDEKHSNKGVRRGNDPPHKPVKEDRHGRLGAAKKTKTKSKKKVSSSEEMSESEGPSSAEEDSEGTGSGSESE